MKKEKPSLESLFNSYSHISPPTLLSYLIVGLYIPFGILLVLFRLIILFIVLLIILSTPSTFVAPPWLTSFFLPFFGIFVNIKGYKDEYLKYPIICCNHCSPFDVFPFL